MRLVALTLGLCASACVTGHVIERVERARETPSPEAFKDPDPRVQAAAVEGCARAPTEACQQKVIQELADTKDAVLGAHVTKFIRARCAPPIARATLAALTPSTYERLRRRIEGCPSADLLAALWAGEGGDVGRSDVMASFRSATNRHALDEKTDREVAFLSWALTFPGPATGARQALAAAKDEQARLAQQRAAQEERERVAQAAQQLEKYECQRSGLSAETASRVTPEMMAGCLMKRAQKLLDAGELDAVGYVLAEARSTGAETASLDATLVERRSRREAEDKQRRDWEAKWGEFKTWRARKENRAVVQLALQLARSKKTRAQLAELHEKEKSKNDAAETEDDVLFSPIFPQTTGSFMFLKILDRNAGEALFSASDGNFVLRLSEGDSFNAFPGQNVHMTMHSRGERMPMTTGARLPVFWSGHSPTRRSFIKGFKPNRTKEKSLLQRLEAERRNSIAAIKTATRVEETTNGWSGQIKAKAEGFVEWDSDADARLELREGDQIIYCVELGLSCRGPGEHISLDELVAPP